MKRKDIIYHYRGGIERGIGGSYQWREGYSEGEGPIVNYPWMTRAECRRDAISQGGKAVFYRDCKPEVL